MASRRTVRINRAEARLLIMLLWESKERTDNIFLKEAYEEIRQQLYEAVELAK